MYTEDWCTVSGMFEVPAVRTTRTRYDDSVKELAYEVYSKRCNGDMPATLRILGELIEPPLSEKTVYQWREDHDWRGRLQAEKEAIAPYSWELWFGGLAVAALDSLKALHRIVQNPEASDRDRIAAAGKIMATASQHIEEIGRRMSGEGDALPAGDLDTLSDADLLKYQEELQRG